MKHFSAPNFQAVLYPDAIELEEAIPFLKKTAYQISISPLHDSDMYDAADVSAWHDRHKGKYQNPPQVGDLKKPHWHVLFHKPKGNGGSRTLLEALAPLLQTKGPSKGKPAISYLGHVPDLYLCNRYHAHLDDPDKAQYDPAGIIYLNGFDPRLIDSLDGPSRTRSAITRVLDMVNDADVISFYNLTNLVLGSGDDDMYDALIARTQFVNLYMNSRARFFYGSSESDLHT